MAAVICDAQGETMERVLLTEEDQPPSPAAPVAKAAPGPLRFPAYADDLFNGGDAIARLWPGVTQAQWRDWRWQMQNRLSSLATLAELINIRPYQLPRFKRLLESFHFSITPYYLSLIDWSDPDDPVRRQCIPDLREMEFQVVGDNDPLEEDEDTPTPGLVHRYPDRVLAVVTNRCSMYCRHCTRKRIWHRGESERSRKDLQGMISYVRSTPQIREVIVSGGDPLTMNLELLDWFLGELGHISHVEVLRIGTRVPVVMPMRVTDDVVTMLRSHRPLWLNTQFNHPREVTPESQEACDRILSAGIPVSNQSVLLRGINDTVETMRELCHALQRIMVRPYYLYQCDPVRGVEHFRTNIWKGMQIIELMRGYTGGLTIPTFVIDAPGGGGKVPLQPFYLLSVSEHEVLIRNYEGMIFKYFNPSESDTERPRRATSKRRQDEGMEQILDGTKKALVPEDSPRYRRRRQKKSLFPLGEGV